LIVFSLMGILSDRTIKALVACGELKIDPYDEMNVQSASVDLRLGKGFLVVDYHKIACIFLDKELPYIRHDEETIIIPPGHFVLGTTLESIALPPTIAGRVEGRSSIGRRGFFIQNAGWIDPGFYGTITLELYNANESPIKITSGRRICQLVLQFTDNPVEHPYRGKYFNQNGATGSLAHKDYEC